MRTSFIHTLTELAAHDHNVMLLTGDLGFSVFEKFRQSFPKQFLNAGVSEQNLIGTAAGLSMCGKRVFVYSIIPFVTFRCLEHIRNDICYHELAVCIVGVGGGYGYGHQGSTHHALEDVSVLRSLPNMTVICPGDPHEVRGAVGAIHDLDSPCYLRLGKAGEPVLHAPGTPFSIGTAIRLSEGTDVTIIATGSMLETATLASKLLKDRSIRAGVISMHTIKPLDDHAVATAAKTGVIVTIEEHSAIGGLGSAVAESIARQGLGNVRHLVIAAPDAFSHVVGSQQYLRERAGLTPATIANDIETAVTGQSPLHHAHSTLPLEPIS